MAQTVTIPWGDGTDDNIYLTFGESVGDQEVIATFDMNSTSTERSKRIRLRNIDDTKVCYINFVQKRDGIGQMIIESTFVIAGSKIKTLDDVQLEDNLRGATIIFKNTDKAIKKPVDESDVGGIMFNGTLEGEDVDAGIVIALFSEKAWVLLLYGNDIGWDPIWIHDEDDNEYWVKTEITIPDNKDYIVKEIIKRPVDTDYWNLKDSEIKQN